MAAGLTSVALEGSGGGQAALAAVVAKPGLWGACGDAGGWGGLPGFAGRGRRKVRPISASPLSSWAVDSLCGFRGAELRRALLPACGTPWHWMSGRRREGKGVFLPGLGVLVGSRLTPKSLNICRPSSVVPD